MDAERRFTAPEETANSAAGWLWPPYEAAVSGERETSRTLPADCLSDSPTFWALFEVCVGTRITLPEYDVGQCYQQTLHRKHAEMSEVYTTVSVTTFPQAAAACVTLELGQSVASADFQTTTPPTAYNVPPCMDVLWAAENTDVDGEAI